MVILFGILAIVGILYFLVFRIDNSKYYEYLSKYNLYLENNAISRLLNADAIGNIPKLLIKTSNAGIEKAKECYSAPVLLTKKLLEGDNTKTGVATSLIGYNETYLKSCKNVCGSLAKVLPVQATDEFYIQNKRLDPGVYCTVESSDASKCNLRTGYVVANGFGGFVCLPKYPNMFGGPNANQIVACEDSKHPMTGGLLWDNRYNTQVDATSVIMSHEDELLDDGRTYRFSCQFNDDINFNPMIPHPANRFHPIQDKCLLNVYAAHRDAHVVLYNKETNETYDIKEMNQLFKDSELIKKLAWKCDCGDAAVTRLAQADDRFPKSPCSACRRIALDDKLPRNGKNIRKVTIPYNCFSHSSELKQSLNMVPCNGAKFTNSGAYCDTIDLTVFEGVVRDDGVLEDVTALAIEDQQTDTNMRSY